MTDPTRTLAVADEIDAEWQRRQMHYLADLSTTRDQHPRLSVVAAERVVAMEARLALAVEALRQIVEGTGDGVTRECAENALDALFPPPPLPPLPPGVTIDENVMGGAPCIAGHRMPTASVYAFARHGYTAELIVADVYPSLTREQVETAIRYERARRGLDDAGERSKEG